MPPLSDEVVTAIRADPLAAKEARFELACNACGAKIRTYAALARINSTEQGGFAWYQELPDRFACSCGRLTAELDLVRRGLHGLLGHHMRPNGALSLVPMYQRTALEKVVEAFVRLLDGDPEEERVQEFLSANPVVLGQFAPRRLLPKASILNKYRTDFTLVNHRSELVLIELERPGTKLLKADGGVSAQLQAPLDQVYDWLHEVDEHFHAVLSCLSLVPGDVSAVRAVVIAGRDRSCDANALRKLKKRDFGRKIDVLTYDDLVAGFANLIRNLGS